MVHAQQAVEAGIQSNKQAKQETHHLKKQLQQLREAHNDLEEQMRKATPRGRMMAQLGSADLHIMKLNSMADARQANQERIDQIQDIKDAEQTYETGVDEIDPEAALTRKVEKA